MNRKGKLNAEEKARILVYKAESLHVQNIARRVTRNESIVRCFPTFYKQTGSLDKTEGSGREKLERAR